MIWTNFMPYLLSLSGMAAVY